MNMVGKEYSLICTNSEPVNINEIFSQLINLTKNLYVKLVFNEPAEIITDDLNASPYFNPIWEFFHQNLTTILLENIPEELDKHDELLKFTRKYEPEIRQ